MKKYKVLTCVLQGLRKTPFEGGEIVTESNFAEGAIGALVSGGFLAPVEEPEKEKKPKETKDK